FGASPGRLRARLPPRARPCDHHRPRRARPRRHAQIGRGCGPGAAALNASAREAESKQEAWSRGDVSHATPPVPIRFAAAQRAQEFTEMQSRWSDADAKAAIEKYAAQGHGADMALRVYTTRLLGGDPALVLHGGGNTSVKIQARDIFGDEIDVLCVKGSGWDM